MMLMTAWICVTAALSLATGAYSVVTNRRLQLLERGLSETRYQLDMVNGHIRTIGDRLRVIEAALEGRRR